MLKLNGLKSVLSTLTKSRPHYKNRIRVQIINEDENGINFALVDYRKSISSYDYDDWLLYMNKNTEVISIQLLIKSFESKMDIVHDQLLAKEHFKSCFNLTEFIKIGEQYELI